MCYLIPAQTENLKLLTCVYILYEQTSGDLFHLNTDLQSTSKGPLTLILPERGCNHKHLSEIAIAPEPNVHLTSNLDVNSSLSVVLGPI